MPHLVEESYEVLDALADLAEADADDDAYVHLEEELGDLLFQIVFHARLADEAGQFDLADVARRVHDKLVHRHPHVFGDVDAGTAEQVVTNWEAIKKSEKGRTSVTEGIPASLPALMLTTKLARKARAVGLEPDDAAAGQAARALAALTRQAEGADPQADDPLSVDGGDLASATGRAALRGGEPGPTARCRCGAGAARPCTVVARGHSRSRRRPRRPGGQPLTLCPVVPPGGTAKERCREQH